MEDPSIKFSWSILNVTSSIPTSGRLSGSGSWRQNSTVLYVEYQKPYNMTCVTRSQITQCLQDSPAVREKKTCIKSGRQ